MGYYQFFWNTGKLKLNGQHEIAAHSNDYDDSWAILDNEDIHEAGLCNAELGIRYNLCRLFTTGGMAMALQERSPRKALLDGSPGEQSRQLLAPQNKGLVSIGGKTRIDEAMVRSLKRSADGVLRVQMPPPGTPKAKAPAKACDIVPCSCNRHNAKRKPNCMRT